MKQSGFTLVEVVVGVMIVALLAAGGYLYYSKTQVAPVSQTTVTTAKTPAVIQTNADLGTAMTDLDQTNIDTSLDTSLTQLDQDASNF